MDMSMLRSRLPDAAGAVAPSVAALAVEKERT